MSFVRHGSSALDDQHDIELQRPKRLHVIRERTHNIHTDTNAASNVGFVDYGEEKLNAYMRGQQRTILSGTEIEPMHAVPYVSGEQMAYGQRGASVRVRQPKDLDTGIRKSETMQEDVAAPKKQTVMRRPSSAAVPSMTRKLTTVPKEVVVKQGVIPVVVYKGGTLLSGEESAIQSSSVNNNSSVGTTTTTTTTTTTATTRVRPSTATVGSTLSRTKQSGKPAATSASTAPYHHLMHSSTHTSIPQLVMSLPAKKSILSQFRSQVHDGSLAIEGVATTDVHSINPQQGQMFTNLHPMPIKPKSNADVSMALSKTAIVVERNEATASQPTVNLHQQSSPFENATIVSKSQILWSPSTHQNTGLSTPSIPLNVAAGGARSLESEQFVVNLSNTASSPSTNSTSFTHTLNDKELLMHYNDLVFDVENVIEQDNQNVKAKIATIVDHNNTVIMSRSSMMSSKLKNYMSSPRKGVISSDNQSTTDNVEDNVSASVSAADSTTDTATSKMAPIISTHMYPDSVQSSSDKMPLANMSSSSAQSSDSSKSSRYTQKYTYIPHKELLMAQEHVKLSLVRNTNTIDEEDDDEIVYLSNESARESYIETSDSGSYDQRGEVITVQMSDEGVSEMLPAPRLPIRKYAGNDSSREGEAAFLLNLPPTELDAARVLFQTLPIRSKPLVYDAVRSVEKTEQLQNTHKAEQKEMGLGHAYKNETSSDNSVRFSDILQKEEDVIGVYKKVYSRPQSAVKSNSRPQSAVKSNSRPQSAVKSNSRPQSAVLNSTPHSSSHTTNTRPQSAVQKNRNKENKTAKSRPQSALQPATSLKSSSSIIPTKLNQLSCERPIHASVGGDADILQLIPRRPTAVLGIVKKDRPTTASSVHSGSSININTAKSSTHDYIVTDGQASLVQTEKNTKQPKTVVINEDNRNHIEPFFGMKQDSSSDVDVVRRHEHTESRQQAQRAFASTIADILQKDSSNKSDYIVRLPQIMLFLSAVKKRFQRESVSVEHSAALVHRATTTKRPQSAFSRPVEELSVTAVAPNEVSSDAFVESRSTRKSTPVYKDLMLGSARLAQYFAMLIKEGRMYIKPTVAAAVGNISMLGTNNCEVREVPDVVYFKSSSELIKKKKKSKGIIASDNNCSNSHTKPSTEQNTENIFIMPESVSAQPLDPVPLPPFAQRAKKLGQRDPTGVISQYQALQPKENRPVGTQSLEERQEALEQKQKLHVAASFPSSRAVVLDNKVVLADQSRTQYGLRDKDTFEDLFEEPKNASKVAVRPVLRPEDVQVPLESAVNALVEELHNEVFKEVTQVEHRTKYIKGVGVARADADKALRQGPEQIERLLAYGAHLDRELRTNPYQQQKYYMEMSGSRVKENPRFRHSETLKKEEPRTTRGWSAKMRDLAAEKPVKVTEKTFTSSLKGYYQQSVKQDAFTAIPREYGADRVLSDQSIAEQSRKDVSWVQETAQRQLDAVKRTIDERFHAQLKDSRRYQ